MVRPLVRDECRQRIAQACESCRRRKLKCTGGTPCPACDKAGKECIYAELPPGGRTRVSRKARVSQNQSQSPEPHSGSSGSSAGAPPAHASGPIMPLHQMPHSPVMAAPPVMHAPAPISTGGRQPSPFTSNRPAPAIHHILRLHMAQPEHFQTGQFVTCSYCYSIQSHLESHGSSYAPAGQSQYQGAYTMANNFGLPASPPASHGGYGEQQYGFGTSSTYNNNDNMSIPAPAPASFGQDRDEPDNNPFSMFLPAPAPTSQFQDSEQTNETNSMDYNNSNYYNMAIQDPAPASFGQNGDQPYDYHPNLNNPNLAMAAPECPAAL